jgi:hypothetical protein
MASSVRRLATARDLLAFHAMRERTYAFFESFLRAQDAREVLAHYPRGAEGPPMRELREELGIDLGSELGARRSRLVAVGRLDLACARCDRAAELRALTREAGLTAEALRAGDLASASRLAAEQGERLVGHASDCLLELATQLVASRDPLHMSAGCALAGFVANDRRLLGEDGDTLARSVTFS